MGKRQGGHYRGSACARTAPSVTAPTLLLLRGARGGGRGRAARQHARLGQFLLRGGVAWRGVEVKTRKVGVSPVYTLYLGVDSCWGGGRGVDRCGQQKIKEKGRPAKGGRERSAGRYRPGKGGTANCHAGAVSTCTYGVRKPRHMGRWCEL